MMLTLVLKTITGIQINDNTLREELERLEHAQHHSFFTPTPERYTQLRRLTNDAYQGMALARQAIERARNTSCPRRWRAAYELAQQADLRRQNLLLCKLEEFARDRHQTDAYNRIFRLYLCTSLGICIGIAWFNLLTENQLYLLLTCLMGPFFIEHITRGALLISLCFNHSPFINMLIESHWAHDVLTEAQQARVTLLEVESEQERTINQSI